MDIFVPNQAEIITSAPRGKANNPAIVYLTSLPAKSGRRTQKQALTTIAAWLGGTIENIEWGSLRYAHTTAIKAKIIDSGYAPATIRKYLSALRGALRAAWRLGQMSAEDLAKAIDLGKVGGSSLPAGRYVGEDEITRLFQTCISDTGPAGVRDAALLAMLYGCGLRREEAISLNLEDLNREAMTITIHGKRDKERVAYLTNGIADAMGDWLDVRGKRQGPLFLAINKSGKIRPQHRLSSQMVYMTVRKRLTEAGLDSFSPHSLRRSFCSRLLDSGVDILTVSKLAGHANVQTTAIYDRRDSETQRQGAETLHIPYARRTA